jgi:hypothetical protein
MSKRKTLFDYMTPAQQQKLCLRLIVRVNERDSLPYTLVCMEKTGVLVVLVRLREIAQRK